MKRSDYLTFSSREIGPEEPDLGDEMGIDTPDHESGPFEPPDSESKFLKY